MSAAGTSSLAFRDAHPSEDDELARIMYNAFLPTWIENWFQCLDAPIDPVPSLAGPLTPTQARRLAFYRSMVALNRMYHGAVTVAYTPAPDSSTSDSTPTTTSQSHSSGSPSISPPPAGQIAAVALLLPPGARPGWFDFPTLVRSGFLSGILSHGLRGAYRILVTFHGNVETMIARSLKRVGVADGKEGRLLYAQVVVRNPEWRGDEGEGNEGNRGPARQLLAWGVGRWRAENDPQMPCWLDCWSDSAERSYRTVGFEVLDSVPVETGCDAGGIKLGAEATKEEREAGRQRQRVMLWRVGESQGEK